MARSEGMSIFEVAVRHPCQGVSGFYIHIFTRLDSVDSQSNSDDSLCLLLRLAWRFIKASNKALPAVDVKIPFQIHSYSYPLVLLTI